MLEKYFCYKNFHSNPEICDILYFSETKVKNLSEFQEYLIKIDVLYQYFSNVLIKFIVQLRVIYYFHALMYQYMILVNYYQFYTFI